MNSLDKQYIDLLHAINEHGVVKEDRTGTGTRSIFGYTIRHNMQEGFPLLTTKKMHWKSIVTELLWFLRGDTNIKYLVDNNCHIWDGDAYKAYREGRIHDERAFTMEEFINEIKTNENFASRYGELGPIYGAQWRNWTLHSVGPNDSFPIRVDQIKILIEQLKTNPDSRRLMVNAWNVGELDEMTLPPCHYGFQVYTRKTTRDEKIVNPGKYRAISLMWNQRSADTFLGLPFNIASYGLLLTMIADEVNMLPDQLIGNLGDVHLYLNHEAAVEEQIGRYYSQDERHEMLKTAMGDFYQTAVDEQVPFGGGLSEYYRAYKIPYRTREPFKLPTVHVRDGIHCSSVNDVILENYQSHPAIKAPLSN
jgi:thymidylate synthase